MKGIIFAGVAAFLIAVTPNQVDISAENSSITSRTFPYMIFGIMLLSSIVLILKGIFGKSQEYVTVDQSILKAWSIPMAMLGIVAVYAFLMGKIGYLASSLLAVNAVLVFLRCRKWYYYLISSAAVVAIYFIFTLLLSVPLPALAG